MRSPSTRPGAPRRSAVRPSTLFDVPGDTLNRDYMRLRDVTEALDPTLPGHRDYLTGLWRRAERYLDNNFRSAFVHETDQRFFEMRLVCAMLDLGFELEPAAEGRPDVATRLRSGQRLWIEAVAPGRGSADNPDRAPDLVAGRFRAMPADRLLMRYTQAILSKRDRFAAYMAAGVVGPDDLRVIAVSSGGLWPYVGSAGLPHGLSAVIPLGQDHVVIDPTTLETVSVAHDRRDEIVRSNGSPISTLGFFSPAFELVSGVIFDSARIGGFNQQHRRRFSSISNPWASARLPPGFFPLGTEFTLTNRGDDAYELTEFDHPTDGEVSDRFR